METGDIPFIFLLHPCIVWHHFNLGSIVVRVAIIGMPSSGKSTVFQALSGKKPEQGSDPSIAGVQVPDDRVDVLSQMYKPKKTIKAVVEFVDLPGGAGMTKKSGELGASFLHSVRPAQALLHVIDGFSLPEAADEFVSEAIAEVDAELALADLSQCEKRLERLRKEGSHKSGPAQREFELLEKAQKLLGEGTALRGYDDIVNADELKSFSFLTAKPIVTLVNIAEGQEAFSVDRLADDLSAARQNDSAKVLSLCAGLEAEIAELSPEEAREFLADYGISEPARELVIRTCYDLLGLMSFFTVGPDEVRAWTVAKGSTAVEGAGAVHSDIARGFIRAEVIDYETVVEMGGFDEAKKKGKLRLEGKDYQLVDGDVVNYRFNV